MIYNLKYKGYEEIGIILGNWYVEDLKSIKIKILFDVVILVLLYQKKFRECGYNQVVIFGYVLFKGLDIDYNEIILFWKKYFKMQFKKNFLGRLEGIENVFDVYILEKNYNKYFLFVDDVFIIGVILEVCL